MVSDFVNDIIDSLYLDEGANQILRIHSGEVARKALEIAGRHPECANIDMQFLEDAAMLHDIGILRTNAPSICCYGPLPYICHGTEGRKILDSFRLDLRYGLVCERHTGSGLTVDEIILENLPLPHRDMLPVSTEERIICYADKFFSKSGDLRREKPLKEVLASLSRHGDAVVERFMALHSEFGK